MVPYSTGTNIHLSKEWHGNSSTFSVHASHASSKKSPVETACDWGSGNKLASSSCKTYVPSYLSKMTVYTTCATKIWMPVDCRSQRIAHLPCHCALGMGILSYQNGVTQWLPEKTVKKILKYFWDVYAQKGMKKIYSNPRKIHYIYAIQVLINRQVATAHNRI